MTTKTLTFRSETEDVMMDYDFLKMSTNNKHDERRYKSLFYHASAQVKIRLMFLKFLYGLVNRLSCRRDANCINPSPPDATDLAMIDMKPCVSLPRDDIREAMFCINFKHEEPDYDTLRQSTLVNQVQVRNLTQSDSSKRIFEIAIVLKNEPRVATMRFEDCMITDLGSLCLALTGKEQLAKLYFYNCVLENAAAESLRLMLEFDAIAALSFQRCTFSNDGNKAVAKGMCSNQSLIWFEMQHCGASLELIKSVHQLMRSSRNLVTLELALGDNTTHWELFHAAVRLETLQSLTLHSSLIDLEEMEGLATMCIVIQSLKTLNLCYCHVAEEAAERLVRTLTDNEHLESLGLVHVRIKPFAASFPICGSLKVRNLDLTGTKFDSNAFSQTVDDVANNRHVKLLNLWDVVDSAERLEKVCNVFLLENMGPSELPVNQIYPHAVMLTEALQQNTSLKALTIANLGDEGGITFAQGLATMHGIRSLHFGCLTSDREYYSKQFFQALEQSLEVNTNLWTITFADIYSDEPAAEPYLPRIRHLLAINRVGRHSVVSATIPTGIWAQILARSSKEIDGIYFVLTGKPDIVTLSR
jgi:hypothetical protein